MLAHAYIGCFGLVILLLLHWNSWGVYWYLPEERLSLKQVSDKKYVSLRKIDLKDIEINI